jgi:hypothetical protein
MGPQRQRGWTIFSLWFRLVKLRKCRLIKKPNMAWSRSKEKYLNTFEKHRQISFRAKDDEDCQTLAQGRACIHTSTRQETHAGLVWFILSVLVYLLYCGFVSVLYFPLYFLKHFVFLFTNYTVLYHTTVRTFSLSSLSFYFLFSSAPSFIWLDF